MVDIAAEPSEDISDANERIMVAVTNAPGTAAVLRRAARIAKTVKSDLDVVFVETKAAQDPAARGELDYVKKSSESVGGVWHVVQGDDPAHAIVDFARAHNITQIVLGSSRRSRLEAIARGSIVSKVLRFAADHEIDVHVIARREEKRLSEAVEE